MRISGDSSGLKRLEKDLRDFGKQVRFAHVVALTRTAGLVADAERHEIADSFDRPTPYTMKAVFTKPAKKEKPEALVGLKDDTNSRGIAPTNYLAPQIESGSRQQKRFEVSLEKGGYMPKGWRAVPGRFARLDAYGNIAKGQIIQILSQLRITLVAGFDRNLPRRDGTKKTETKIRKAFKNAGGQFFAVTEERGRGNLRPGIYQARDTGFGRTAPRPVVIFVRRVNYERRLDWDYTAELAIDRNWKQQLDRALDQYAFGTPL